MEIEVVSLTPELEPDWTAFCQRTEGSLLYHSLRYRDFLSRVATGAQAHYRMAISGKEVVGILPLFLYKGPFGVIANSLPFFGSHGGPLTSEWHDASVIDALLRDLKRVLVSEHVIAATVIENPYAPNASEIAHHMPRPAYRDSRTGQVTAIPAGKDRNGVREALLSKCHQKTRNLIRKGIKAGFSIDHDESIESMRRLATMHADNMKAIGGKAKPVEVFQAILDIFEKDGDYRIYSAIAENEVCAATLLVFYYKNYVEYFTPCINPEYRSDQPLSALILEAMTDASIERGATRWNWGGTWKSQDGVYRFKSRWGAVDRDYSYCIYLGEAHDQLKSATPDHLLDAYPYFFTIPFAELRF